MPREKKSNDFLVTPPLYMSGPGDTNALRLVYVGPEQPKDRESLYYFIEKSIPSVDKDKMKGKNTLLIATANRLKLFARPKGLSPSVDKAPEMLTFSRQGKDLSVSNPSPYYLTVAGLKASGHLMKTFMVPPKGNIRVEGLPAGATQVTFSTINDFGGSTPLLTRTIK